LAFSVDQMLADLSEQTERGLAAGFVATMIATVMLYYGATAFALKPYDLGAMLAARMGNNMMLGHMGHYVTGVIAFPAFFIAFWRVLPGPSLIKGLVWGVILFWLGHFFLLPLANGGFLPDTFGWRTITVSFLGHLVYGFILTGVLGDFSGGDI